MSVSRYRSHHDLAASILVYSMDLFILVLSQISGEAMFVLSHISGEAMVVLRPLLCKSSTL